MKKVSNYQHERGWLDSEVWGDAPYSERDAWSWMIGEAFFQDGIKNIGGHPILLKRGQFSHSIRFMALKFKWGKGKVERYIKKLLDWKMIKTDTENGTGQTIVTICNYDKYQTKKGKSGTQNGTEAGQEQDRSGTEAGQSINPSIHSIPSNNILHDDFKNDSGKHGKKKTQKQEIEKPENVSQQVWDDFVKQRKKLKATISQTALNGIKREADKSGCTLQKALETCCERGWRSFKAEWVNKAVSKATPYDGRESKPNPLSIMDELMYGEQKNEQ